MGSAGLKVTILSVNAVLYEITFASVTVSVQSENTFNTLPYRTYVIRVYDDYDIALTKIFTLVPDDNTFLLCSIKLPDSLSNCDETAIINLISIVHEGGLVYPIIVSCSIYPPIGSATVCFTQTYDKWSRERTRSYANRRIHV